MKELIFNPYYIISNNNRTIETAKTEKRALEIFHEIRNSTIISNQKLTLSKVLLYEKEAQE